MEAWEKQAIKQGPGIEIVTVAFDWPRSPNNRLVCSLEHPMPKNAAGRWEHADVERIGRQDDGWPSGDIVTNRCRNCGKTLREELPQ